MFVDLFHADELDGAVCRNDIDCSPRTIQPHGALTLSLTLEGFIVVAGAPSSRLESGFLNVVHPGAKLRQDWVWDLAEVLLGL
jgi:hypothetical protein